MKKGLIFGGIVVFLAVVLVLCFVFLFTDKTTSEVANEVIEVTENGYLSNNSTEYSATSTYLTAMKSHAKTTFATDEYYYEVRNVEAFYSAYIELGEFYRLEIAYTDYNSTYSSVRKTILNAIDDAQGAIKSVTEYLTNDYTVTVGTSWEVRTWDDVREYYITFIEANNTLFEALAEMFEGCGSSLVLNNDFTNLTLQTANEYLSNGYRYFQTSVAQTNVTTAKTIAQSYLAIDTTDTCTIFDYIYNTTAQKTIADIIEKGAESASYSSFIGGTLFAQAA